VTGDVLVLTASDVGGDTRCNAAGLSGGISNRLRITVSSPAIEMSDSP
jgi:hypothetical protein